MTSGDTAGAKPDEQPRPGRIRRWWSETQHDAKTHVTAYIANGAGIAAAVAALFVTTIQNGGWVGPSLLSLAILMVSIGFVGYQMADAKRTDQQLALLDGKLKTIVETHAAAVAVLEAATKSSADAEAAQRESARLLTEARTAFSEAQRELTATPLRKPSLAERLGFARR
jgi:hypothetical protein